MARLVSDVITEAQEILQDAGGTRYSSASMIRFINDAVLEARSIRPDLFVGAYLTALPTVSVTTDPIPLPNQFFTALVYYVAGRAELRDDEFAVDGRAMTLAGALKSKLIQGI